MASADRPGLMRDQHDLEGHLRGGEGEFARQPQKWLPSVASVPRGIAASTIE